MRYMYACYFDTAASRIEVVDVVTIVDLMTHSIVLFIYLKCI